MLDNDEQFGFVKWREPMGGAHGEESMDTNGASAFGDDFSVSRRAFWMDHLAKPLTG